MMRALTICQPYASLIILGEKRVENRSWKMSYRGQLLIHAGKSRAWLNPGDIERFEALGDPLVFGALLGTVDVIDCLHIDDIESGKYDGKYPWVEDHEHTEGPFCIVVTNARRFPEPIPCRGERGLWHYRGAPP